MGIGDRYDYRHLFYTALGHDRGRFCWGHGGGTGVRKIGSQSPACGMGHPDWKYTRNRVETGFYRCGSFLLRQGDVLGKTITLKLSPSFVIFSTETGEYRYQVFAFVSTYFKFACFFTRNSPGLLCRYINGEV